MNEIKAVTVYCSSSRHVAPEYFAAATELGSAIAAEGWRLVYGGNNLGLMDAVATAARAAGGKVTGITPQRMADEGIADRLCDELICTNGMRERKALLEQHGDAFVVLPGGLGTFEEFFEILVGRLLGYHDKPIVLLNVADYYAPLLAMIQHGVDQRFIKPRAGDAYVVAATVDEAMALLRNHLPRPPLPDATVPEPSARE